ncbi:MAG: IS256 family transposase [Sphingobacterium sp.]|jgi:transposase-like protein|nr:IS256 family transposase [Sphingobacterium sp.]
MAITKEVLDELLKEYKRPDDFYGPDGLIKQLSKALIERAMQAELTEQIGYEKNEVGEKQSGNRRNGKSSKTLRTDQGPMEIAVPRDRDGEYDPQIIAKHQREWRGFDEKIMAMYSHGMTTQGIQATIKEIYNVDVSSGLVSRVTDEVKGLVEEWRNRPLEPFYPVIFFDALRVNIRDEGHVTKKAIYLALSIRLDGQKEILGMWIERNEGSKFWMGILNELKNRGVQDILLAAVDGLTGFPDAIQAVFPKTEVQLCIVHMVRNSVKYVPYKDRKAVTTDLKEIYLAPSEGAAAAALERFAEKWSRKYPAISKSWQNRWSEVTPFMKFSPEIRKAIYTTNAIESVNYNLQRNLKLRQSFPNDESAMKLIFMILQRISKRWTMPIRNWGEALHQFAVIYGDRVPL